MHTTFRIVLCVCLLAVAVTMAAFTMADLTKEHPTQDQVLRLGAWEGSVAIFDGGSAVTPRSVTDIALSSLRAADRAMIERGYPVGTEEELQSLLEDLGS